MVECIVGFPYAKKRRKETVTVYVQVVRQTMLISSPLIVTGNWEKAMPKAVGTATELCLCVLHFPNLVYSNANLCRFD